MEIITSIGVFTGALVYIAVLFSFGLSPIAILRALVLPMVLFLIILYRVSPTSWRVYITQHGRWFILFLVTVIVQLLVVSTGGIQSPFLILIHLFMVGISFAFGFVISGLFLIFSIIVIIGNIILNPALTSFIQEKPHVIILHTASVIPIMAVAYIISQLYHIKDSLSKHLGTQLKADEAILSKVDELIIITDPQLNILSVNDAVERALQKSRSELINKPLFQILLIKNTENKLINNEFFFPDGKTFNTQNAYLENCTIVNTLQNSKGLTIQVQPIEDIEARTLQISFILSYAKHEESKVIDVDGGIERSRTKYTAIISDVKNKLHKSELLDTSNQLVLAERIEKDVFMVQELLNHRESNQYSRVDIAQLCKQCVQAEEEFSRIFQIPVTFTLAKFGWKDIEPLTVKNYAIAPEELTGPFFTIACDVNRVGFLIKKILDLIVMLSSTQLKGQVNLSIEQNEKEVIVRVFSNCPPSLENEYDNLFVPYYNYLSTRTNLQVGSGLEGYLIKNLTKSLNIPFKLTYYPTKSTNIEFMLTFKKNFSTSGGLIK